MSDDFRRIATREIDEFKALFPRVVSDFSLIDAIEVCRPIRQHQLVHPGPLNG
jgi:hypothetical protein